MTIRQVNGVTVTSEKIVRNTSKTYRQLVRRVQLANLVNLWRAFAGTLHPSFENRAPMTSDYNMFVGANLGLTPIYLTKSEAAQGATVVDGVQITRGSLPAIDIAQGTGGVLVSDLELGALTIDGDTTLADFSQAVIGNNGGWADGDQLSAFVVRQHTNPATGLPYVTVEATEITLNSSDEETLLVDLIGESDAFANVGGKLGLAAAVNGAVAYVHSRKTQGKTLVSTQHLEATNSLVATYRSAAQLSKAVESYGGKQEDQFLTPDTDEVVAPVGN